MPTRGTKVIATVGPASAKKGVLRKLIKERATVFRVNCSHSDPETQQRWVKMIREVSASMNRVVAIMFDLQGPRIRLGEISDHKRFLRRNQEVEFINGTTDKRGIPVEYPWLTRDVSEGDRILVNDGKVCCRVTKLLRGRLKAKVLRGGEIGSRKGVVFPDSTLSIPTTTDKDKVDIRSGISLGVDYFALSFVKNADDVRQLKKILSRRQSQAGVIAKIERREAVENIRTIVDASDGIMVARGDLGIEISLERVPAVQRQLIREARMAGKPVITATQMLESMIHSEVPTRAEVSDVSNAVRDGTDAVMVSGETAIGSYPVGVIQWIVKILRETEISELSPFSFGKDYDLLKAISENVKDIAQQISARLIVCFTRTGLTARILAATHPHLPAIALTTDEAVCRKISLYYGVRPFLVRPVNSVEEIFDLGLEMARKHYRVRKRDKIVLVAGSHFHRIGNTDLIKIIQV